MTSRPPPPQGVVDVAAWERFCELVAGGGGVFDHPHRAVQRIPASESFFQLEIDRVAHHQRNTIPFLLAHCGLAGASVLEFGAGTGGLAVAMTQVGAKSIDAVEPIEANGEAGRWRITAYGLGESIRFHHVPDTRQLPFDSGAFDLVVCSSVLQHVPDVSARRVLLKEMARVLRPGGLLVFCGCGNSLYPGGPHSTRWWSNLLPALAARRGHNRGISFWELNRGLRPLGLRITPQGSAALERWRQRSASRHWMLNRPMAVTALRVGGQVLGLLMRAPLEAFLPYPDLAFRKDGGKFMVTETRS